MNGVSKKRGNRERQGEVAEKEEVEMRATSDGGGGGEGIIKGRDGGDVEGSRWKGEGWEEVEEERARERVRRGRSEKGKETARG